MERKITDEELQTLGEEFKGKGGNCEAESIVCDSKMDKDFITIWSNKSDVSRIIKRCRPGILSAQKLGDGVQFYIDREFFRGVEYCLTVSP